MKVSIIIPAYNEEKTILEVVDKVLKLKLEKEIIVVDDGSTCDARRILSNFIKNKKLRVIRHKKNMGKGFAIRTGLENATGEIIVIQDADLEYPPIQILNLIKPILDGKADVVYGSRFLGNIENMSFTHTIGNKVLTFITRLLYGSNITDMETGHKAFKKKVIDGITLNAKKFEIEPELTAKILMKGYEIVEVPVDYTARSKGEKKIGVKDGLVAFKWLLLYRFCRQ
jgi:glycosyltransferase involved in cell wall biosynthesis